MKRILIFTDSLGLPRTFPESCEYEETWPVLLKEKFLVHQVSIGGATSAEIRGQLRYHENFNPDLVIVQVGIVDCAPRFLTRKEQAIIKLLPFNKKIFSILNKPGVKKKRKITYTKLINFIDNINFINEKFNSKVLFLGILPSSPSYEIQLPGISKNIQNYNEVLSRFNYLNFTDFPLEGVMSDNHHINGFGHKFIYDKLINYLGKYFFN